MLFFLFFITLIGERGTRKAAHVADFQDFALPTWVAFFQECRKSTSLLASISPYRANLSLLRMETKRFFRWTCFGKRKHGALLADLLLRRDLGAHSLHAAFCHRALQTAQV